MRRSEGREVKRTTRSPSKAERPTFPEALKGVPEITESAAFYRAVAACLPPEQATDPAAFWPVYSAAKNALIDWLSRGQRYEKQRHGRQAKALRDALAVMREHRSVIEHNLGGRVIYDPETGQCLTLAPWLVPSSPVNAGPVLNAVSSVLVQLASDLETRDPEGMADRKDRSFGFCLGRALAKAGQPRLPMVALRSLCAAVGANYDDDANALHAFNAGCMSAQKID